jgi:hypothetical protein
MFLSVDWEFSETGLLPGRPVFLQGVFDRRFDVLRPANGIQIQATHRKIEQE